MTTWKPSTMARLVHRDPEIEIYSDGTWLAQGDSIKGHWIAHSDAVVHADGAGDARITTKLGRSKVSKVTSPTGRIFDIRGIAAGTAKAPA